MRNNIPLIPSIVHKLEIEELCKPLTYISNIKDFVLYIIFNDGQKFVLSSTPNDFLTMYWHETLNMLDHSSEHELFINDNYYLCNEKLGAEPAFKEILEAKFNMYRTFYTVRKCPECRFVFGALHDHQVLDPAMVYKSAINKFEDFCVDFIDKTIDLIKLHNPEYNRSIVLNDKSYRKSVIKMKLLPKQQLTEREVECLYWAAHGKSSDETATILKIKKYTVEEYRKNIKQKLNCYTMAHAVYEGIKRGYIGAFNRLNPDFYRSLPDKSRDPTSLNQLLDFNCDKNS